VHVWLDLNGSWRRRLRKVNEEEFRMVYARKLFDTLLAAVPSPVLPPGSMVSFEVPGIGTLRLELTSETGPRRFGLEHLPVSDYSHHARRLLQRIEGGLSQTLAAEADVRAVAIQVSAKWLSSGPLMYEFDQQFKAHRQRFDGLDLVLLVASHRPLGPVCTAVRIVETGRNAMPKRDATWIEALRQYAWTY
jgi:hypothetical protein